GKTRACFSAIPWWNAISYQSSLWEWDVSASLSSDQYDNPKEDAEMIETATKPYRLASGEGLADVWWKTGRVTVKVAGVETGNAFSQIEVDDPCGGGTPLHVHHNEDETFYVLEGELTFF